MAAKLILASSSPRRQELLRQVHIPYKIRTTEVDELSLNENNPQKIVQQLALIKAESAMRQNLKEVILAADTIICYQDRILGKPNNKEEAMDMLSMLSGNEHEVYTGVAIQSTADLYVFFEKTKVTFWPLSPEEIEWYIETKEPFDKAGAYGIQGSGAIFVKKIVGDYYNVVGLPISRVVRELRRFSIYPEKQIRRELR